MKTASLCPLEGSGLSMDGLQVLLDGRILQLSMALKSGHSNFKEVCC
ncbi:MAG: hypothetical protein V7719_16925 [Psychroserpens sp.]